MSENPLLPHRKLQALHALMLRCRELARKQADRKRKARDPAREALLAATSIHLQPGDLLSASPNDLVAFQLAPETKKTGANGSMTTGPDLNLRLTLCAAAARGLQASGTDGLALAFTEAGSTEPGWREALEWAQQSQVPLLIACADATGGRARSGKRREPAFEFAAVNKFAKRLKLPVLTVDGEDAVAVYRVMQESVLRARLGGGPAVLWAVMTPVSASSPKLPRASQPIHRLEKYLTTRKIPFSD